jgi:hypothetical protein
MSARRAIIGGALALLVIAVVVWKAGRVTANGAGPSVHTASPEPKTQNAKLESAAASRERSALADALNSPANDIRADLRLVSEIIDTFRTNFPRDGNPVGNNAEITAVLSGRNQLRLALIPPDHPAINQAGELCDRWGTPFFFHAESANKMEIRSAGPDRKMWNEDDVVASP